jgi:hypothetical protein
VAWRLLAATIFQGDQTKLRPMIGIASIVLVCLLAFSGSLALTARNAARFPPTPNLAEGTATALAAEAIATARSAWPLVLSDSFDNNNHGWHTGSFSDQFGTVDRSIQGGRYRWEIKAEKQGWSGFRDTPNMNPVSDFSLTAIGQCPGTQGCIYGVVFRDAGEGYYVFEILSSAHEFAFERFVAEPTPGLVIFIDWTKAPSILPDQPNRLGVTAEGSHFIFFINNRHVAEDNDNLLSSGKVGLFIGASAGNQAVFDHFEVRAP